MSDKEKDEEDERGLAKDEESDHVWLQRQTSPELRWLDLFEKLVARVETNEADATRTSEDAKRTSEDTQRNINFIVQQQAQFTVDIQLLRESQARADQKWERTEEGIRNLLSIAEIHEGEIAAVSETTRSLTETTRSLTEATRSLTETTQSLAQTTRLLAETTRTTDERLNALINMVERDISERHNGEIG